MEFKIIRGKFLNNSLTDYDTGEVIRCLTYGIVRERINGEEGFFHLKKDRWENEIIFQYVLSPQDEKNINKQLV